ncbi:MAG: hypothetical protein WD875_17615 [Pirellulales bacterium]
MTAKLEVRGDLKLVSKGKETTTPLTVVGDICYDERLLAWGKQIADESRAIRQYSRAEANIAIDAQPLPTRTLPEGKRLVAAQVTGPAATLFAPRDTFTRDDLDLVTLPGISLAVDRLLPDEPVAVGDSWKPSADAITVLCDLDEVDSAEVEATLKEVTATEARCELAGNVAGRVDGVKSNLVIAAKFTFDRVRGRISWLAMSVKEQRDIGSVAPGVDATSRLQMRVEPLDESPELADRNLVGVALEPTAAQLTLIHHSAAGRFSLAHDRRWHVVTDDERVTVLRMMEDGELIAQANITPLAKQSPGKTVALEAFEADVERLLGKNLAGVVKAGERMNERDYRVCRVEAIGKVNDLDIQWVYYHVTDKEGRGAAVAVTLDSKLAERFAGDDDALIGGLQLLDPSVPPVAADDIEQSAQRSVLEPNPK